MMDGKKRYVNWVAPLSVLMMTACASNARLLRAHAEGTKSGIFQEISDDTPVPAGYADIELSLSIKTHALGHYRLESGSSLHGKPGYPFILNIDGQAIIWKIDGTETTDPDRLAGGAANPERGNGVRYLLAKKIRVPVGPHRVFFGLPGEDVVRDIEVDPKGSRIYSLNLVPSYGKRGKQARKFTSGVSSLTYSFVDVTLDRKEGR